MKRDTLKSIIKEIVEDITHSEAPLQDQTDTALPTASIPKTTESPVIDETPQTGVATKLPPSKARKKRIRELASKLKERIKMDENGKWVKR